MTHSLRSPLPRLVRHCGVLLGLGWAVACAPGDRGDVITGPPLSGSLVVVIEGLAGGVPARVTVTGPGGYHRALETTTTLTALTPGSYTVVADGVTHEGHRWEPSVPSMGVVVTAGATPASTGVSYLLTTGALTITITGLPPGIPSADLTLSGPGGFSAQVTATTTLVGLLPGLYTVSGGPLADGPSLWAPALPPPAQVAAQLVPAGVSVVYGRVTGSVEVTVSGLPVDAAASLALSRAGGPSYALTGPGMLTALDPGTWVLAAETIAHAGHTWAPSPESQEVTVAADQTTPAGVTYSVTTGALAITVTGLPPGAAAAVGVSGPGGFTAAVTGTQSLLGLAPGSHTITASNVSVLGQTYIPSPLSQTVSVPASVTPTAVQVSYTLSTGSLLVSVGGLPTGVAAAVTVTGPAGYEVVVPQTETLTGLSAGTYTVAAAEVTSGGTTWEPSPASQVVGVTGGATSQATVTYGSVAPPTLNLRIDGAYLTQATQRYDGTAPLVSGRDAYLRVFVVANEANAATPVVRVRLYHDQALVQTAQIQSPGGGVPTAPAESDLGATWNLPVPGSLVQPDLRLLVDVDPGGLVAEADESDNFYPASGTPQALDVRALPTFRLRFVPVLQQVNGLQGNVTTGNAASFLADTRRMLPVADSDVDIRDVYTTTAPELQASNGNNAWNTILSEVLALKTADGSTRYYYGVVKTSYTSGVAGIGYVGGSARTALGWDYLPSGSEVMAHELGHNMGRRHAPCGGAGNPDPAYPYPGGSIGVWGLDVATLTLKSPDSFKDIMGYCTPDWISDYHWAAMVDYRGSGPNNTADATTGTTTKALLLWGRITRDGPVLEPAFVIDAPAAPPPPGPHRIQAVDAVGGTLFSVPFLAVEVDHTPDPEYAFAFALPVDDATLDRMAGLRLTAGGRTVTRGAALAPRGTGLAVLPIAARRAEVRWDGDAWPMAMIRDAVTGRVLSLARHGSVVLPRASGRYQITLSDGVRSLRESAVIP